MKAVTFGIPANVAGGVDLETALQYGNNEIMRAQRCMNRHRGLLENITHGRVVVLRESMEGRIQHSRISPLAVVEPSQKSRVILHLSSRQGGGESLGLGGKGDTDCESAPDGKIEEDLSNVTAHTCALQVAVGSNLYTSKMDIKYTVFVFSSDSCLSVLYFLSWLADTSPSTFGWPWGGGTSPGGGI